MFRSFTRKLWSFCSRIRWLMWRRSKPKVVIRRFGKCRPKGEAGTRKTTIHLHGKSGGAISQRPIRIVTFNAAMFSLAPAVPQAAESVVFCHEEKDYYMKFTTPVASSVWTNSVNENPKSILKQSPEILSKRKRVMKSQRKVSINLPDNEISLAQSNLLGLVEEEREASSSSITSRNYRSRVPMRSPVYLPFNMTNCNSDGNLRSSRSILEVLKEMDADILALQDVKAQEEKGMKPLSDLASALGMQFVFAESWAPEYGNAVLSKWPIKRWKVQKIVDDEDFRNVLKVTIDVPWTGEVNFHCTQLDHLDENWRMKQINAIIKSVDCPHILAGGLNSLNGSDYSSQRWMDIIQYYEEIGKPRPRAEVTKFLEDKGYTDAKDFAGECEPVVVIAKGQNVQGTCKYGTRVDYVLASPDLPYKFVPGSYSVISSKGTSDHHIVKVDIVKVCQSTKENTFRGLQKTKQKVVRVTSACASRGIWQTNT